ncbi:SusC/RagA family TonB-linked outer membrane protein [Carboxylicivirga taeanensis]|uniref:SusC/RagA family TonB-linked outer membrane protein n=1 Tax=Carboxylicivirga taeanensis TaxID=1416875 RepID=UPI003F6DC3EB
MRLSILLCFSAVLTVSANSYSQSKRVNLNMKDVSISKLFEEIRQQSNYSFFFNEEIMAELSTISIDRANVTVEEVLKEVLDNTNLTYTMVDDVIIIKNREEVAQQDQNSKTVIKGVVADSETGESLPGVNIMVKNGALGTVTDINGQFEILVPPSTGVLVFSFIGYETQEVKLDGQTNLNVLLMPEMHELGDVVVTGYQVIDKRELTSAIEKVTSEDLELKNALTVDQMLEGKATGLEVTNISTTPGAAAKIRIRSGNTFTGNQSPLWVIDGVIYEDPVPLSADDINSFDNVNIIGNALTGINPQDIESINVLKDASATAIYGIRAAGGVIAVTTKRGQEGKPTFSYSFSGSVVERPSYSDFELMNSKERIAVSREMYERNLGTPTGQDYENVDRIGYEGALLNYWDGTYTFEQFQNRVSYLETLNADWFDELYRPAFNQNHNVNVSGGSKSSRYYVSIGYDEQKGVEKGVDLNRITGRANLDFDLKPNIRLSLKMNGSVQEGAYNHGSVNVFNEAYYTSRTVPIYDEDGNYFYQQRPLVNRSRISDEDGGYIYGRYNVLSEIDNSAHNITNKDFGISAQLQWDITSDLTFRSLASYRNTTNLQEEWIGENTFYVAQLRTYDFIEDYIDENVDEQSTVPFGGLYSGGMTSQNTYAITNQLNYKKVLGRHVLNVNLSQEARSTEYWGANGFTVPGYVHENGRRFVYLPKVNNTPEGFDFDAYAYDNMINWFSNRQLYPSITDKVSNAMSFFGVINYVYDNRYVLNFNMRSDGTNAFGQFEEYRFKPTWSVSSRWNIHNEHFWNRDGKIDELALRVSYGVRGTIPSATPYMTIRDYGPETNNSSYFDYNENVADLVSFPQTNLRWELNKTTNVGLNYSLFAGRVSGAFDYSYSFNDDLLLMRPVSLVNGAGNQLFNGGSSDVQSYEFNIRTVNINRKDFSWSTRFNFSRNIDRVLKGFDDALRDNNQSSQDGGLTISQYLNGRIYKKGFPSSGFYSYQFDGLDENGLPTFKYLNTPELTQEEQLEKMLVYEGQRTAQYHGGFGTEFRYKRLTMSANFSYKLGYKVRLLDLYNGSQQLPLPYENMRADFNNRWRQPGNEQFTNIPALSNDRLLVGDHASNYRLGGGIFPPGSTLWELYDLSDARTVKGDHIRLTSISLSYSMPNQLISKMGLQSMRLGVQASNVAVWAFDKKLKGQDPNQVRNVGLPSLPTFSFSLNVSL